MEDEEKKDNNTFKDGFKKGAVGFLRQYLIILKVL